MKILLVIDHFGSGGAQRQSALLAKFMTLKGYDVHFFNYYPEEVFFRKELERSGVKIHDYYKGEPGFSLPLVFALRRLLKTEQYDAAISFLDSPSYYLILSSLFINVRLVVSDRNSYKKNNPYKLFLKRQVFRLSSCVVANSVSQKKWLVNFSKLGRGRVFAIYNGYEAKDFPYAPLPLENDRSLRIVGIGRINPQKNIEFMIEGLSIFHNKNNWCPSVTWVGRCDDEHYKKKVLACLENFPEVNQKWAWHDETADVHYLLSNNHVLVLPSHYEGLPNVVCEAMLSGCTPVISNVCDNSVLLQDGEFGELFDIDEPEKLSAAIENVIASWGCFISHKKRKARAYVEEELSVEKMAGSYIELLS